MGVIRAHAWRGRLVGRGTWLPALIGALCVVLSLVLLAMLSLVVGVRPAAVLGALVEGALGGRQALVSTLREMVPLALCGLAFQLPFRAGFFNIGGQGQLEVGALAAVALTTWVGTSSALTIPLALGAAAAVGAAVGAPALALKLGRGASEVTSTIMINFAAVELVLAMVTGPMKDPTAFFGTTYAVPLAYRLPLIPAWSGVHLGVWIAIACAAALGCALRRTIFGFNLAALGGNRDAARAAGIPVDRTLSIAVLAGAGLAGLAGGIQALGVVHRVAEGWSNPWGFVGILAALLAATPLGVVGAAFLLAVLETGGRHMQAMTGVPSAMVYVLQGFPVLLFLALRATPLARRWAAASRRPSVLAPALAADRASRVAP